MLQGVAEESWQSVEIPQEFSDVLNGIVSKPSDHQNMSLTILNSSANKPSEDSLSNNKSGIQGAQS